MLAVAALSLSLNVGTPSAPARAARVASSPVMMPAFLKKLGLSKPDFGNGNDDDSSAASPNPVLALAGKGMSLIGPLFTVEAIAQVCILDVPLTGRPPE